MGAMSGGERRRLLFGVHGYGRGHAARAQAVLPRLAQLYEILVLAGDDAYDQLRGTYPVRRIPVLRYHHDRRGRRSALLTAKRNIPAMLDLLMGGAIFQMVRDEIRRFAPDVVLSDSEPWTHHAARDLGIPRISFDHYGIMVHCRPEMSRRERFVGWMESLLYRRLVCNPERIIVSAFYDAPPQRAGVHVVGPILREPVRQRQPSTGEYLLAYFSNASVNYTPRIEQALKSLPCPVKIYGTGRCDVDGNIEFCPAGDLPFVRDLAECRAVFSTAGNQLISEAIHFGKPVLVMPEDSLEQQLNARIVHAWRIGMRTTKVEVSAELLLRFMGRADEFAGNVAARRRDGLAEALQAIEQAMKELALTRARPG